MSDIEFYYDVVCPYAYLGALQIERLQQQTKQPIHWKPILLGGIFQHNKSPNIPAQTWPAAKIRYGAKDLMRQAAKQNTTIRFHPKHPVRTVEAMRLLSMVPQESLPKISLRIFRAYWEEGKDISDINVLNHIAEEENLSPSLFSLPRAKETLIHSTKEAHEQGVFGVPSFLHKGKIWWGQDRIHLLQHAMGAPPKNFVAKQHNIDAPLDFYHDFASPFSYLGAMQIPIIEETYGIKVNYKPILLGALFRNIGTPDVPLFAMSESKQQYMMRDLHDWSDFWKVLFSFPSVFPVRSVLALRLSLIAPECTHSIYQAMWVEGRDIGSVDVLKEIVESKGLNWDECMSKIPVAKEKLIENTAEAEKIGICGVPSLVYKEEIWWGQDRIHDCMEAIFTT